MIIYAKDFSYASSNIVGALISLGMAIINYLSEPTKSTDKQSIDEKIKYEIIEECKNLEQITLTEEKINKLEKEIDHYIEDELEELEEEINRSIHNELDQLENAINISEELNQLENEINISEELEKINDSIDEEFKKIEEKIEDEMNKIGKEMNITTENENISDDILLEIQQTQFPDELRIPYAIKEGNVSDKQLVLSTTGNIKIKPFHEELPSGYIEIKLAAEDTMEISTKISPKGKKLRDTTFEGGLKIGNKIMNLSTSMNFNEKNGSVKLGLYDFLLEVSELNISHKDQTTLTLGHKTIKISLNKFNKESKFSVKSIKIDIMEILRMTDIKEFAIHTSPNYISLILEIKLSDGSGVIELNIGSMITIKLNISKQTMGAIKSGLMNLLSSLWNDMKQSVEISCQGKIYSKDLVKISKASQSQYKYLNIFY
jgi:hypothetical protein